MKRVFLKNGIDSVYEKTYWAGASKPHTPEIISNRNRFAARFDLHVAFCIPSSVRVALGKVSWRNFELDHLEYYTFTGPEVDTRWGEDRFAATGCLILLGNYGEPDPRYVDHGFQVLPPMYDTLATSYVVAARTPKLLSIFLSRLMPPDIVTLKLSE